MPRLQTVTSMLVLQQGQIEDTSPYLTLCDCQQIGAAGSQSIALLLEPVEESPRAGEIAAELAERLVDEIHARRSQTTTAALLASIETVNALLVQLNAVRPPRERCHFGFTCVLTRGDEAYIAQAAPSQVLIAQEGEIYAFPGLDSWRWNTQETTGSRTIALPLGLDDTQPDLYHTRLAGGDLIALCSSSIARVIDRAPQDAFVQGDARLALDHLDELARLFQVDTAWLAVIAVPESQHHTRGGDHELLRKATTWISHFLPEETAERLRQRAGTNYDDEVDLSGGAVHTDEHTTGTAPAAYEDSFSERWDDAFESTADLPWVAGYGTARADALLDEAPKLDELGDGDDYWEPEAVGVESDAFVQDEFEPRRSERGRGVNDLIAGALLAFSAAVVGVRQITVNRDRLGPRDDGTLGVPRLSRYDDNIQLPDLSGVRSRLPRIPISRTLAVMLLVLVVGVGAALAVSVHNKQVRQRQAQITALFQNAESLRQQAGQNGDPAAAQTMLQAASESIQRAEVLGLDQQRAANEQSAISGDLDKVQKIERLANVQVLGTVPAAPQGVTPRVFSGNGQTYILTDALYRLDSNGATLVRLIGGGDKVGTQTVGTLTGAAWGDGAPVVFDGSNAYLFDPPTGTWTAATVETLGSPLTGIAAVSGYSGNLYLLSPASGQIVKYPAGSYNSKPEDWTAGAGADDLKQAVDFFIDGHIYVLTQDGRLIDFFMGAEQSTVTPHANPALTKAVGLSMQTDRPYYYVAESNRLLRLDRSSGDMVQQFLAGSDSPQFTDIKAISVDDVLGTAYILNGNTLLSARLPAPSK